MKKAQVYMVFAIVALAMCASLYGVLAFKMQVIYELQYSIEISGKGNFTINIPIPPKLSWQKTLSANVSVVKGEGKVSYNLDKGYIRIFSSNYVKYEAKVNTLVTGTYSSRDILRKLNITLDEYLAEVKGDLGENYTKLVSPTYWWNYSDPRFETFLKDFLSEYNITSIEELKNFKLSKVVSMIRQYVARKLNYTPISGGRQNIFEALNKSLGDCSEYSDAFVVFSRYIGIPTLRCIGYVANEWNSKLKEYDIMGHAWPIIYVSGVGWIPYEVTVGPGYLKGSPGDVSPKYICLVVDKGVKSMEYLDLKKGVIYDPEEHWVPGSSSAVHIDDLTVTVEITVKPKPQIEIHEEIQANGLSILVMFFPIITTVTLSLAIMVTVGAFREH